MKDFIKPIIGQEAVCPDGLGRVEDFSIDLYWIEVRTYIDNIKTRWDYKNITLVKLVLENN